MLTMHTLISLVFTCGTCCHIALDLICNTECLEYANLEEWKSFTTIAKVTVRFWHA